MVAGSGLTAAHGDKRQAVFGQSIYGDRTGAIRPNNPLLPSAVERLSADSRDEVSAGLRAGQ
jgi:hypothetical protein